MRTQPLYYDDCHIRRFTATVLACRQEGQLWQVELDRTAFFPEGGGQACDTGMLGDAAVLQAKEQDGAVWHLCDKPLTVGQQVAGEINWDRRFDQMQQHAAEHILSGLIHKKYGYHNTGFHVGALTVTVDFDGPIPAGDIPALETACNRIIWENRPITCWYPGQQELPQVKYRCKRELPWPVRIVDIQDADTCACCGVHVAKTGEIGVVKLLSCVKFHQGVRIEMVSGGRALDVFQQVWEQNRQVSQAFSAKVMETGEAARKMNEALAAEKFRSAGLEKQVFAAIAESFRGQGDVVHFEKDLAPGAVRELADAIAGVCGGTAAVFSGSDASGYSLCLVNKTADVKQLGQDLAKVLQGRGGGKPGYFQGSIRANRQQIEEFFSKK